LVPGLSPVNILSLLVVGAVPQGAVAVLVVIALMRGLLVVAHLLKGACFYLQVFMLL